MHAELAPWLVLAAATLWGVSGIPGLFIGRTDPHSGGGQGLATALGIIGSVLACAAVVLSFSGTGERVITLPWHVTNGAARLGVDALSAWFLVPLSVIGAAGSIYGHGYWPTRSHPLNARRSRVAYGALIGSLMLVHTARHGLFFVFVWELMALSAFFLVSTEDEDGEVRAAGWLFLLGAHVGALCLLAAVALLANGTGSLAWEPRTATVLTGVSPTAIFLLAFVGCAFKAGLVPFHFWLPPAHAHAPSHASAILSGVMLNAGVYGLLRFLWLLPVGPSAWGVMLMVAGGLSAIYGMAVALGQADYKRLLAYSSVENMGIIHLGIGVAVFGLARHDQLLVEIGLAGALLHVWNHSLFKGLLFLGAGAVLHATGTRVMDRLGGLFRRMPVTATCMLVGAVAAAGLPPLNAFMSEWLLYIASFQMLNGSGAEAMLAMGLLAVLALTGGLALAAFTKLFGITFLGVGRTEDGAQAEDPTLPMRSVLLALVIGCLAATWFSPDLAQVVFHVTLAWQLPPDGAPVSWPRVPHLLWGPTAASLALVVLLAAGTAVLWRRLAKNGVREGLTWDCGYAAPTSRMQYTARSYTGWLAGLLQPAWMRVRVTVRRDTGLFPLTATFESASPDPLESRWYRPIVMRWVAAGHELAARFQRGQLNLYLSYILLTLLALFGWMVVQEWWARWTH